MDVNAQLLKEKKYSLIAEFVHDSGMAGLIGGYCEENFPIFYANENIAVMLGYDNVDDLIAGIDGKVSNTIHPDDMEQVMKDLGSHFYEGMTYETTYRMPRKDGSWFWTVDRGKVIKADDGRLAIISICYDMTQFVEHHNELTKKQKCLEEKKKYSDSALGRMPGGYHRCSPKEGFPFLYVSDRFCDMLGWTKEEIATKFDNKFINLVHPDDREVTESYVEKVYEAYRENRYQDEVYRLQGRDGYRWVTDSTVFVDLGEKSFLQGSISDITPFIEKENKIKEDLQLALDNARMANESKTNFLFNISHEIRTPLNAILGFNELAKKYTTDERAMDALKKATLAGKQLLGVINEILDMSRIQSGKMELNIGVINVKKHIAQIDSLFRQMAAEKDITFQIIDKTTERHICGDGQRVSQILTNLLANAIKFTPKGGTVTYEIGECVSKSGKSICYDVHIKDTGIGMSKAFQEKMYTIFERETNATTSETQGTGLGLSIAKSLTEQMHGTLQCNSELGKGTEFIFRCKFPLTDFTTKAETDVPHVEMLRGKHILLVEDNELNSEIAKEILKDLGCTVERASNGLEAVRTVMQSMPGDFELVLMDIQMPIMDGYKATGEIRHLSDKSLASIPIVAMTANAFEEDRKKSIESGMNDHIAKPIDADSLGRILVAVFEEGEKGKEHEE